MRASFKRHRVKYSSIAPPSPSSTGDTSTEASVDLAAAAAVTPPSTLDNSNICRMLETVMTIQVAHGQLLVDMLDELQSFASRFGEF